MIVPEPFKTDRYITVDCHELNRFVSAHYGRPWSILDADVEGQNTYQIVEADGEEADGYVGEERTALDAWLALPVPDPEDWRAVAKSRDRMLSVDIVLWDLCRKQVIPAGTYLIMVWW